MGDNKSKILAQPLDASVLVDIWLDGYLSGATSTALHVNGGDVDDADKWGDKAAATLVGDPAAMEVVRNQVRERLLSIDGSPYTFTLCHRQSGS